MRLKQTVERTWGVWIYDVSGRRWEPWTTNWPTRKVARVDLRDARLYWPGRRFAIVRTVHTRQVER